jgi:tetratricopeptide (TPR) repeat protein
MTEALDEAVGEGLRAAAEAARAEALALLERGDFPAALLAYDRALDSARATNDAAFADWMFVCRASAAVEAGPADDVLVELKRVLLRSSSPATAVRAAHASARVYELRRDFEKALFYNRIARRHAEAMGDEVILAHCDNQSGMLLTVDSRFEEAAGVYRRALERTEGRVDVSPIYRAVWRDNLGYCLLALDRVPEGLACVHEAFDALEREDAKSYTVFPLLDLCFGYLKIDRHAEARFFGEAGLTRVPLCGEPAVEKTFLYLLGETCHLAGDDDSARTYFDRLARLYPEFKNLRAYLEVFDFRNVINLRS